MNKIGAVITVVGIVFILYLILLVVVPWLSDITVSVNSTLDSTSNMSLYPGTSDFLLSTPWIMFFVPGAIGIALIIVILRMPSGG